MRGLLGFFAVAVLAHATTVCTHVTDGTFEPGEWTCPTVSVSFFPQVASGGGAYLYADQGQNGNNNLYLMYDYVGGSVAASFFDVFFEVVPDANAYLVRIPSGGGALQTFERPIGSVAPLLPNGSFDVSGSSGWTPLTPADLALAQFQGAVGFGPSPNNATPHPMAEFQLTVSQPAGPSGASGANGIYSPAPAFWGASEKSSGGVDPPISSGIFMLNPDGTTTIVPVLGPNGGPLQQGSVLMPEPGTIFILGSGLLALLAIRGRKTA